MSPRFHVVTEKVPGRIVEAETASKASQKTPGKTISVEPVNEGLTEDEAAAVLETALSGDPKALADGFREAGKILGVTGGQFKEFTVRPTVEPKPVKKMTALEDANRVLAMPPRVPVDGKVIVPPMPTEKQLKRHAALFDGKKKPTKKKGVPQKVQIFELIDHGNGWEEVCDLFNVSPSKEKALRNEYLARKAKEEAA